MIYFSDKHVQAKEKRRCVGVAGAWVRRRLGFVRQTAAALVGAAVLSPTATFAADANPGVDSGGVLKALLALALVLVVVFAIAWVARRISPSSMGGNSMKLQGGLSVGARERVMLVEVKDTWLVVGVAPGSVNLLHTLPRPEESAAPSVKQTSNANFASWLSNAIKRQTNA